MAWTTPRTWASSETVTASLMNTHLRDNLNYLKTEVEAVPFPRGGVLVNDNGIDNTARNIIVWYASKACTVLKVRGYRVGGTGATVNARKNGTSNHLSSALSLTSADTWTDGGTVQNTSYSVGDKLEIMVVTTAGDPTQIAIQVDFEIA